MSLTSSKKFKWLNFSGAIRDHCLNCTDKWEQQKAFYWKCKLLHSRGTRERILILFRRCKKSRFFVDCKLAAPLGFCRGFGPRFRVHLSRHACSLLWLLSLFFEVFFELVFNSDCIRQKGECSPNADWSESFWSAKTNNIIAKHVYTRRFVRDRSFLEVFILDRA